MESIWFETDMFGFRICNLARSYAEKRQAFGATLAQHPLHMQTLARLEVQTRGSLLMLLEVCRVLGLEECGQATEEQQLLLRILSPLLKLFTGKQVK